MPEAQPLSRVLGFKQIKNPAFADTVPETGFVDLRLQLFIWQSVKIGIGKSERADVCPFRLFFAVSTCLNKDRTLNDN